MTEQPERTNDRSRADGRSEARLTRAARLALASSPDRDSVSRLEDVAVEAWQNLVGSDGFLPVLLLLFVSMVATPLVGDYEPGVIVAVTLSATALLFTVFRSTHRRKIRAGALIYVAVAASVATVAVTARTLDSIELQHLIVVVMALNLAVQLAAFPLVLIRSFQHRRVTVNTVCATLSAYLLIGLIFTTIYRLFGQLAPPFFVQFEGGGSPSPGEYTYFSFITLTTVGFGDLTPASDPARAFVMVEAVLGQVFLVTMLARVVGLLGVQRALPADPGHEHDEDDEERGGDAEADASTQPAG